MPTTINIPACRERHCEPCEFHKMTAALHVRSGGGGYRRYSCTHPEAFEPLHLTDDPEKNRIIEKLKAMQTERDIGKTDLQPNWCPLLRKEA